MKYFAILILLFASPVWAFTAAPDLTVTKPGAYNTDLVIDDSEGGGEDYSICASGCDYTSLDAFEDAQVSGATMPTRIKIKTGTYNITSFAASGDDGSNEIVWEANGDGVVTLQHPSGGDLYINGSYVIFAGGASDEIVFSGANASGGGDVIPYVNGSYVQFDDVVFDQAGGDGGYNISNPYLLASGGMNKGSNNLYYNCTFRDTNGLGLYFRDGSNCEVKNCYFYDIGGVGLQVNPHDTGEECATLVFTGNIFRNVGKVNSRAGISILCAHADSYVNGVSMWNNIIEDSYVGIKFDDPVTGPISNIKCYHNTVYNSASHGIWNKHTASTDFQNNISGQNGGTDILNSGSWSTNANNYDSTITSGDFYSVTYTDADYMKLHVDSDARGENGTNTNLYSDVTADIHGTARPNSTDSDAGASEYSAGADVTAPTLSNGQPSTSQTCTADPRNVLLSWDSDEVCNCRISTTDNDYDTKGAGAEADSTDDTSHSHTVSQACDGSTDYYVRCKDAAGNESTSLQITPTVSAAAAQQSASSMGGGSSGGSMQ